MKICIASDIHMEIGQYPGAMAKHIGDGGDVLVLAGDITCARYFNPKANDAEARSGRRQFDKLVKEWGAKFKRVFYVMGNHEHYGYFFNRSEEVLKEFLKDTNVRLLQNEGEIVDSVPFFGATFWTDFGKNNPMEMEKIRNSMNDFRTISIKGPEDLTYLERHSTDPGISHGRILPSHILDDHYKSKDYLFKMVDSFPDKPVVVITHHAPSYRSQNMYRHGTELIHAYCSSIDEEIEKRPQIKLWFHGHTHDDCDYMIGHTRVLSNQRGYYGYEPQASHFKPKFVELDV